MTTKNENDPTESVKIKTSLLNRVRRIADKERRTYRSQLEIVVERGLSK